MHLINLNGNTLKLRIIDDVQNIRYECSEKSITVSRYPGFRYYS